MALCEAVYIPRMANAVHARFRLDRPEHAATLPAMGFYAKDEPAHPTADKAVARTPSRDQEPRPENAWQPILTVGIGHRFYSPALGRWVSRDPLWEHGPGGCQYILCSNSALNRFDYIGLIEAVAHEHPAPEAIVPEYVQWPNLPKAGARTSYPVHEVECECRCPEGRSKWTISCTVRWTAVIRINAKQQAFGKDWPGIYGHEQRHVQSMIQMVEEKVCGLLRGKRPYEFSQKERCEAKKAGYVEDAQPVLEKLTDPVRTPDHKWNAGASRLSPPASTLMPPLKDSVGYKDPPTSLF